MSTTVAVAALTDIGCSRSNNEDSFGYDPARQVYVVCDGMGGMDNGEVASQMAVASFLQTMATHDGSTSVEAVLHQAISLANESVHKASLLRGNKGMGTTLVTACIQGNKLVVANVGDSRAYLIQKHQCRQVTVDHSYLNELIRSGIVKVEDAQTVDVGSMKSVITRAVGVTPTVTPDFYSADLQLGDILLLASDGLTRYVDQHEISLLVGRCDLQASARNLIGIAKERGGSDNITVLLLQLTDDTSTLSSSS